MMLKDKVALVIGGTSGIGRATAIAMLGLTLLGLFGFSGTSTYNASKHAVIGLTRCLRLGGAASGSRHAKQRIQINAINPEQIATEMIDRLGIGADNAAN